MLAALQPEASRLISEREGSVDCSSHSVKQDILGTSALFFLCPSLAEGLWLSPGASFCFGFKTFHTKIESQNSGLESCPLSTTSACLSNTSRNGDSTISLGSLFQCLATLFGEEDSPDM